jgi:hypothetical protein
MNLGNHREQVSLGLGVDDSAADFTADDVASESATTGPVSSFILQIVRKSIVKAKLSLDPPSKE